MSTGRFKSKDDYFTHKSGLAERVISVKTQKVRRRTVESNVPATLLRVQFCKTVDEFEIEGKGRFMIGEYPLDDAIKAHLDGDLTVLVNPLSRSGETAFTVAKFDLSEAMDHPFSSARQFADELGAFSIPCLIEVNEGGKGHYHLWIFHEEPVPAWQFSEALIRLGASLFNTMVDTIPSVRANEFIPLPLQGESLLLQRRVFVNAVGKMIRDQANVLRALDPCPRRTSSAFIEHMNRTAAKTAPPQHVPTVRVEKLIPVSPPAPAPAPPVKPATGTRQTSDAVTHVQVPVAAISSAPASPVPAQAQAPAAKKQPAQEPIVKADVSEPQVKPAREVDIETPPAAGTAPKVSIMSVSTEESTLPAAKADSEISDVPVRLKVTDAVAEEPITESVPAAERTEKTGKTVLPEIVADRMIVFERCGGAFGVPDIKARKVVRLGKGFGDCSGSFGTIRFEGETVVLADATASDADRGARISAPCFAIILAGEHKGFALVADRIRGVHMLRKSADVASEHERDGYVLSDGSQRITVPDLDALFAVTKKADMEPERVASFPTFGGKYLILSAKGTYFAIPSEKVGHMLPAGAPDTGVTIDPAGVCVEPSATDKRAAVPVRFRRIVVEGGGRAFTVLAERVIGLETIGAESVEDDSGHSDRIHPAFTASIRMKGRRILILDPGRAV